jgi:hypothetical protein
VISHLDYYDRFYDITADYVIDIEKGKDEFSVFMRRDFDLCQDQDFEITWLHLMRFPMIAGIWQNCQKKSLDRTASNN